MKFTKLSLVTAVAVGGLLSNAYAADTLADAFKNGKVSGELKAYYFDKEHPYSEPHAHENLFATGVTLNYVTDSLYGFKLGTTFQSSASPFATEAAKNMFADDMYGPGAQLSEAYLAYALGKTEIKVGRQFLGTPLVASSGSRIIKEAFEGVSIVNKDLPNTTLIGVYVNKFQYKTDLFTDFDPHAEFGENRKIGRFTNMFAVPTGWGETSKPPMIKADDVFSLAAINQSIPNLKLTGAYARVENVADWISNDPISDVNIYHLEANYVIPMNGFKLGFDALYKASRIGTIETPADAPDYRFNGHYLGGRVGIYELAGFGASFAMGQSAKKDHLLSGVGLGTDYSYTGNAFTAYESYQANTKSYEGKVSYDFSKVGVNGLTSYVQYAVDKQGEDTPGNKLNGDYNIVSAEVAYAFAGALKGFSTMLQYQHNDLETLQGGVSENLKSTQYRFKANYKF